jgi:Skp family chaperone for outer membrane proteins
MRNLSVRSRVVVATGLVAAAGLVLALNMSQATGAPGDKSPVLLIDRQVIMTESKLGRDIHRQIMAYEDKVNAEFGAQGQALRNETQTFQQQSGTLSAADRDKKKQALEAREADYRQKVGARQSLIQGGELVARKRYLAELADVVETVMRERGAEVVVEKSAIVASIGGIDITPDVTQRLDHKITNFKVPLVNPPASDDSAQ